MWRKVLFDFVRQEFSGTEWMKGLVVYCLVMSPLVAIGGIIAFLKVTDGQHLVLVVLGKEPLCTLLLATPAIGLMVIVVLRFMIYLRSTKITKPK